MSIPKKISRNIEKFPFATIKEISRKLFSPESSYYKIRISLITILLGEVNKSICAKQKGWVLGRGGGI